jgi:hypothetical protein
VLKEGRHERSAPQQDGTLRSTIIPGLWLDPTTLLSEDLDRLLGVLQLGLESAEHAAFVTELARVGAEPAN